MLAVDPKQAAMTAMREVLDQCMRQPAGVQSTRLFHAVGRSVIALAGQRAYSRDVCGHVGARLVWSFGGVSLMPGNHRRAIGYSLSPKGYGLFNLAPRIREAVAA
ncbi:MAG: hypothetical protein ACYC26_10105 [Phycisphaerales bacterium]